MFFNLNVKRNVIDIDRLGIYGVLIFHTFIMAAREGTFKPYPRSSRHPIKVKVTE